MGLSVRTPSSAFQSPEEHPARRRDELHTETLHECRMSVPTFIPSGEVTEISRIHYDLEYTEGISQRMRIPETLKVAPESSGGHIQPQDPLPPHSALMQVPERIVVAGDDGDLTFPHPRDLDLIQSVPPVDLLSIKAPPHVLTLTEQPLDSLETDQTANTQRNSSNVVRAMKASAAAVLNQTSVHARARRERSDNVSSRHSNQMSRGDVSVTPSPHAPPLRLCPPLYSPEDANINLFTAAGLLSYIQSTTRRAYQQVLEVLDDGQRRYRSGRSEGSCSARCLSVISMSVFRTHLDSTLEINPDESGFVDASSLRRQIVKLNRRLQLLEEENKERSRREMILYSATVAFWLINTWIWLRR
ncbi:Mitochondrial fission factor-like protein A [Oryzias melastigma]|uniref:Mitochondrial fission factor n=1 Tax=Oryzias melastigma TaxID=30732 RepID=A0A834CF56_ORYME|nr:Mitochondrial fission factor-like protein A [Oryzias melastigma]